MSTTVQELGSAANPAPRQSSAAPLLVASDGSAAADGAIRAAQMLTVHGHQPVRVIAVHAPLPMGAPDVEVVRGRDIEEEHRNHLRDQVLEQLDRVGIEGSWPLDVVTGDPAATIVNMSRKVGASLVIMGLGGHGWFDRILGDEMVLRVLRLGTVPVLAVTPGFVGLPREVVAAIDFSASSARAASLGTKVMRPDGRLTLAHVVPPADETSQANTSSIRDGKLGRAFEALTSDIGCKAIARLDRRLLRGDPARTVLEYADSVGADLIVAGSHGHGFLSRLLLGSVSQRLVRGSRCAVLVAPPEEAPSYVEELSQTPPGFAAYGWAERLEEFTRRNAGRAASLEVIDPECGAQVEHQGLTLRGASFDARNGHVQLTFGESGHHVTRSITGVTAIQVVRSRAGEDLVLRVAHGRAQTLLTLARHGLG